MLFMFLLFIVKFVNADRFYKATNSCIYKPIQNIALDSILQCAIECEVTDCKAFQFDTNNSTCRLYSFHEICQSNTNCSNVTIFINNRFNNEYLSDFTSVPFQLFKGIKVRYDTGIPSAYNILNPNQTIVALINKQNRIMIAVGSYHNSQMITFPKSSLTDDMNKRHKGCYTMGNNFAAYLTKGNCTKYFDCYHSIDEYKKYVGIRNLVFGITRNSDFKFRDLKSKIIENNWHIIISGTFWVRKPQKNIQSLANLYGICITRDKDKTNWVIKHNICKNVTHFESFTCDDKD